MPNEYVHNGKSQTSMATPIKGWSKIISWQIKGGRDTFCFGHWGRARPTRRHFTPHCLCSISHVFWWCVENWKWFLLLLVSRLSPLAGITCDDPVLIVFKPQLFFRIIHWNCPALISGWKAFIFIHVLPEQQVMGSTAALQHECWVQFSTGNPVPQLCFLLTCLMPFQTKKKKASRQRWAR